MVTTLRAVIFKTSPVCFAVLGALTGCYGLGNFDRQGRIMAGLSFCLFPILVIASARALGVFAGKERALFRRIGLFALALGAGFSLGFSARNAASVPARLGLPPAAVTGVSGILGDDPRAFYDGRGMGSLLLRSASGPGGLRTSASGRVPVFFPAEAIPRLKEFGRGCRIYVDGAFTGDAAGGAFRAESVHVLRAGPSLEGFRTGLRRGIWERFAGSPWGGLALALLLGVRDDLDHEMAAAYQAAGCSHVLALSGMHLAIISGLIAFFLKKPLGLRAAAAGGALFILGYVFLAGWQPSLGRAAIMYLLGALAILGNFPRRPGLLLGISFLIQLIIDPASGDRPSFILSYLALFGILHTGEALHGLFRGALPETLLKPLAASLGAFIATQTAAALFFGVLRPAGVIAGLVVVPLITLFMGLSMTWLVSDILFPLLSGPLGVILSALYRVLGHAVTLAARAPGINAPHPAAVLGVSLGLFFLFGYFRRRREKSREALVPFP